MGSLDDALKQIDADFGAGSALRMGAMEHQTLDVIPTGSLGLDAALGVGGYPRGRIVEIYGPESAGKSSLCLHAVANAQKLGLTCCYIDAENSLDPPYASALGVDVDQLIVSQPSTGEQALEIVDRFARTNEVGLIVVDSVAALIPRAELEGSMGDATVGLHARLLSQAMRKLSGPLYESNTCSIWINQLREKIGTMGYGPSETTTGGRALKFFSSIRMDCRRIATTKQGDEAVGNETRVKVVKNKCAVPHKTATFTIRYGEGISRELELITLGVEHGVLKRSGTWISYEGEQLGQGAEKARLRLTQSPETASEIEAKVREKLK